MVSHKVNAIYLNDIFNPKNNSFSFLRFVLAALVIFSHSHTLGGFGLEGLFGSTQETYGGFAVHNFFILSGFLITRSYITSSSIWRFLWNRILRIFPGFWACLILTILVFAPIIYLAENSSLTGYFNIKTDNPLDYLKVNLFLEMRQYGIANLLNNVPFPKAFNGSLWTLIYEFKCYVLIAFIGSMGLLTKYKKFIIYLFLFLWLIYIIDIAVPGSASKIVPYFSDIYLLKLSMYFLAGATYFLFIENIVISKKFFLFVLGLTILSIQNNFYPLIAPLTLPYILFWLAFKLPFANFDRYGDFSYGLYIYAFPIQQMLSFFGLNTRGFTIYFILSLLMSMIPSVLSYHIIEKPFLKLKTIPIKQMRLLFKR
jgi:peptidoglycan/LPS O-acetylase OafA/YrhL